MKILKVCLIQVSFNNLIIIVFEDNLRLAKTRINAQIHEVKEEINEHTRHLKKIIDKINQKLHNELDKCKEEALK